MPLPPDAARHRAPGRARTVVDAAARDSLAHARLIGRRTGVVAAASGLVVTMSLPASAEQAEHAAGSVPAVDVTGLTAAARAALAVSPVVTVPTSANWAFEAPAISVTANPKPVVVERPAQTSRGEQRAAVPADVIPPAAVGNAAVELAARYIGVPYVYGGSTPDGFDCSGFTSYVFAQLGITLPRSSADQRYAGVEVPRDQARPGDLVWYPGHVGIFAGDNTMIDSSSPGTTVGFRNIWNSSPLFIRVAG